MSAKKNNNVQINKCYECVFCEFEMKFETLSVKGASTLGRCPHYTNRKFCVLLTQKACDKFRLRNG